MSRDEITLTDNEIPDEPEQADLAALLIAFSERLDENLDQSALVCEELKNHHTTQAKSLQLQESMLVELRSANRLFKMVAGTIKNQGSALGELHSRLLVIEKACGIYDSKTAEEVGPREGSVLG
jgi:hypothetical protein